MIYLRSLLFQFFFVISSLVFAIGILVAHWFKFRRFSEQLAKSWAHANLAALRLICRINLRLHGMDQLPSEPSVVLCKHQSTWETIALRALLPLRQAWVLKHELLRIPFFGWALARLNPIAIDRSAARRAVTKVIREGERHLADGRWVIVFPEGTRVPPGSRRPYAIGGSFLAVRTGYPVVPIAHNAGFFWGPRSFIKYPGTIDLVVGPILNTRGKKAEEINATAEQWIESTVSGLPRGS